MMSKNSSTLVAILAHRPNDEVERVLDYWRRMVPGVELAVIYGGTPENFKDLKASEKYFVDDSRLRTRDHQREKQSYCGFFEQVAKAAEKSAAEYVFVTEFDHVPLREDCLELMQSELNGRDVLFHGLERVDGTNHPHYLYHLSDQLLESEISKISVRSGERKIYTAFGFGQMWKTRSLIRFSEIEDVSGCYLELWIPTIAHHIGLELSCLRGQEKFHATEGDLTLEIEQFINEGAWAVHPVKKLWEHQIE